MITVDELTTYITSTSATKLIIIFIAICILCVSILYSLSVNFVRVLGKLSDFFKNIDSIGYGKFQIQLHKNHKDKQKTDSVNNNESNRQLSAQNNTVDRVFDVDFFISVVDLVISYEFKAIVDSCICVTNRIQQIEKNYNDRVNTIFSATFSSIYNNLYGEFLNLIHSKGNIGDMDIKNTKEYFFIDNLMTEYKQAWMDLSVDITKRNGFVDFLCDKSKCEDYVSELSNIINDCVDLDRLESISLKKIDIDKVIFANNESCRMTLETMFLKLARLKKTMCDNKLTQLKIIEDNVKASVTSTLNKIKSKILVFYTIPTKQVVVSEATPNNEKSDNN